MDRRAVRVVAGVALGVVMGLVAVSLLMTGAGGARAFDAIGGGVSGAPIADRYEQVCAGGTAVPNPGDNAGLVRDCAALLVLRDALVGDQAAAGGEGDLDWSASRRIHSWEGVGITLVDDGAAYRVTEVGLSNKRLTGFIHSEIHKVARLEEVSLNGNQLTGGIPREIGDLGNLVTLNLSNNQLTGAIPAELGRLVNLRTLLLHNNRLTGALPAELGNLTNLALMGFGRNEFSGCIPVSLRDILHTWDVTDIGLAFCDVATATAGLDATATAAAVASATAEAAPATATPTATSEANRTGTVTPTPTSDAAGTAATPTATATRVPTATATRTPVPTATRVPASGDVVERLIALERQVAALASRVAALEARSQGGVATATPVGHNCVREVPEGAWFGGTWAAGCVTSHPPASNPGGVYYARFYTFTLAAAADVTITLSSDDAAPHLLLLRGTGRGGAIVREASPVSVDPATDEIAILDTIAITASLAAGSYTIESTTYYAGKTGDFRLSLAVGD